MNASHKRYAEEKLTNMNIIVGAPEEMYFEKRFNNLLGLGQVGIEGT